MKINDTLAVFFSFNWLVNSRLPEAGLHVSVCSTKHCPTSHQTVSINNVNFAIRAIWQPMYTNKNWSKLYRANKLRCWSPAPLYIRKTADAKMFHQLKYFSTLLHCTRNRIF